MNKTVNVGIKKLLRVGIYLRLSDEDDDKLGTEESESIKNQRNLLKDEISKRPDFVLVDEYCDEDLSGAGTFRPEFERLIRDCKLGKLDVILCKSQSRFSRDMEIIEKYLHNKFIEWNIRFIGLSDNADTANAGNKKSRQINGLVNEWYLEDVSNNIRSAFHSKMKQGEFISPFASYGYEISEEDNNKLVVDQQASMVVKDIFDLYLSGLGFTGIAKHLNNKNIPSPSLYKYQKGVKLNIISNRPREEIKWTTNAIKTILTNELYIGHLIQGKRTTVSYKNHKIRNKDKKEWVKIKNTHQAIIDEDTFNKVQIAMIERTKPVKNTGMVHNFSGKVFCLECGRYLRKKNNSTGLQYLTCSNNRDGYDNCSNKNAIRYDTLEDIVLNAINEKIERYYDEERLLQEDSKKIKSQFADKINSLEKRKSDLDKKLDKTKNYLKSLYEDKVNGIITSEQFRDLINDYTKSEDIYKNQIKQTNIDLEFYKAKEQASVSNKELFMQYQKLSKLNRVIIEEFIKSIHISEIIKKTSTRNIQIKWNFEATKIALSFDNRVKKDKYTITKKYYIRDKDRLSELQDKYHSGMISYGHDLDRGIKNSDDEHFDIKQYKKITRKLNLELDSKNKNLSNVMEELEDKKSSNKESIFDKEYAKVKKDTSDSMNKVIDESKKVVELQPKIRRFYNEVDTYTKGYKHLEKEN